ncbi:MAG TPA: DUF2252 family protein [Thermoanaerobaculia bacterium]
MKRSSRMTIQQATQNYERWIAGLLEIVPEDLAAKHDKMAAAVFPFLRATYYRWAQVFPYLCKDLSRAPQVLAVGDLHVENFGTWRDAEGRLIWGINDFDETCRLPYVHDLVRLATSAHLAINDGHLKINAREACESILGGYREGLEASGRPFVLAEHSKSLREMATSRLIDPQKFWAKLDGLPTWKGDVPARAVKAISNLLPKPDLPRRIVHRVAGLGSLGRQRFVAIADWRGGRIAREAKALAPSAAVWAFGGEGQTRVLYQNVLDQSVRCIDPWVKVRRRWIVRRLAPDCARVELADLPEEREETRLLRAMGWETANVHLGSRSAHALLVDLAARQGDWLHEAADTMLAAVTADWEAWREHPVEPAVMPAGSPAVAASAAKAALAAVPPVQQAGGDEEEKSARAGSPGKKGRREKLGRAGGGKAVAKAGKVEKEEKTVKPAKPAKSAKARKAVQPAKGAAKGEQAEKRARKGKRDKAKAGKGKKARKGAKAAKGEKRVAAVGDDTVTAVKDGKDSLGAAGVKVPKRAKGANPVKPSKTVKAAEDPAAVGAG